MSSSRWRPVLTGISKTRVNDAVGAGLCHGAAGLAQVFNRLFQVTGNPELGRAARSWLEVTIEMRSDRGVAGFLPLGVSPNGRGFRKADPSFLMGAAGIGLTLMAATTETEPSWDRLLPLSM